MTLKGEITNVLSPLYRYVRLIATFKANDKEYTVHLGPIRYWNQENLKREKSKVEIIGEQEEVEGQWHLYPSKIIQGKNTIGLVTDDGFPKWANMRFGKGRVGNRRGGFNGRCGNPSSGRLVYQKAEEKQASSIALKPIIPRQTMQNDIRCFLGFPKKRNPNSYFPNLKNKNRLTK